MPHRDRPHTSFAGPLCPSVLLVVGAVLVVSSPLSGCDTTGESIDGRIYPGGRTFGEHVSLDGDVALVMAQGTSEAFVLRGTTSEWRVEGQLPFPAVGGRQPEPFALSAALDGDVAVAGVLATGESLGEVVGRAYVFERRSGAWALGATLAPAKSGERGRWFGNPVAVSGRRIAVGQARGEDADPAAVLIFEPSDSGWTEAARVAEPAGAYEPIRSENAASGFGGGVALDGARLAIGSAGQDVDGTIDAGLIRVYEHSGAEWTESARVTHPTPGSIAIGDRIALDGPVLVTLGRSRRTDVASEGRSIYVFRELGAAWALEAELRPPDVGALKGFGWTFDVDGNRLAVSAASRAGGRGSVFVYVRRSSGTWELEDEVWPEAAAPGWAFGEGVALVGDRLLAGAIGVSGGEGGLFEFRRTGNEWEQVR